MKKLRILLFSGCIGLSYHLFGNEEISKQRQNSEVKFTKNDYAKVITASLGCAYFSVAAFLQSYVQVKGANPFGRFYYMVYPGIYAETCFLLPFTVFKKSKEEIDEFVNKMLKYNGLFAGLVAGGMAYYLYKKLSRSRVEKEDKEK